LLGLCPDWEDWNPDSGKKNATEAMDLAEEWLEVPQVCECRIDICQTAVLLHFT